MTMTDEERKQSNRDRQKKYNSTHERIDTKVEIGTRDRIAALGYKSAHSFAVQAIKEKLEREEKNTQK